MGIKSAALLGARGSPLRGITMCFSTGAQFPKARLGTQQLSPLGSEDGEDFFTMLGMAWEDAFLRAYHFFFLQAEAVSEHPSWKHTPLSIPCKSSLEQAPPGLSNPIAET